MSRAARHRRALARALGLCLAAAPAACWTGGAPDAAAPSTGTGTGTSTGTGPAVSASCPARLTGIVHDAATGAPLAGATIVVETARGRVAAEVTDARGRFETAAVSPPARLRIYHGARAVEHRLAACQAPLRIGVRLAP
ncbi:MAG TPA: carboxypeptidase-like regulatory domain-containing protein [Kofleriaceae bacterium]|nr:carboxypeptidase-like regulatory domain-containing protein [Kofleriaceae bacterium]